MWLYLVLIATAIWAITNIADKVIVSKYIKNLVVIQVFIGISGTIMGLMMLLSGISLSLTIPGFVMSLAGFAFFTASLAYYKAVSVEEASRVVPLIFLKALFVLVIATFLFKEVFTFAEYIGIVILIIGAFSISVKKEKGITRKSKAIKFILISVICWGGLDIVSKWALQTITAWQLVLHECIGFFALTIILLLHRKTRNGFVEIWKQHTRAAQFILANCIAMVCALLIYLYALSLGPVSLVAAANSAQALFVLIFAVIASIFAPMYFKEDIRGRTLCIKIISVLLIIVGVYLIS